LNIPAPDQLPNAPNRGDPGEKLKPDMLTVNHDLRHRAPYRLDTLAMRGCKEFSIA